MRHALLQDDSYVWQQRATPSPVWQYGLRFKDQGETVLMVFDLDQQTAAVVQPSTSLNLGRRLSEGLSLYFEEIEKRRGSK